MSMVKDLVTMFLWGLITITLLVKGEINLEHAYIGMCMMLLVAGLLHKEGE